MGKAGNKRRQTTKKDTRRSVEARALAKQYIEELAAEADKQGQESRELEMAYGDALLDDAVPWDDGTGDFSPLNTPSVDSSEGKAIMAVAKAGPPVTDRFMVKHFRDHGLDYPELYLDIFVADNRFEEARFTEMFVRAGCNRARALDVADLCVFTGGPDVDPVLYNEALHPQTRINADRDLADIETYLFCMEHGIPMFGVCRGAQFLHVMEGGKLIQDADGHHRAHPIYDVKEKYHLKNVSSVHHQICRPNPENGMEILATANTSRKRWLNPKEFAQGVTEDIEAFWYPKSLSLGVQGHPEYSGFNEYTCWCLKLIENYILVNPNLDWANDGGRRRLKTDLLKARNKPSVSTKKRGK
jgi:gamma-glutamyl-gamma-aminobutyrate hydrolase PuuD